MAIPKTVTAQNDFSAGELNSDIKRFEGHPLHKAGTRQCENFRILNSGALQQRPGRKALFVFEGRVDEIEVAPGVIYRLCFRSDGGMSVRDSDGVVVGLAQPPGTYPWTSDTLRDIVWTHVRNGASGVDVIITFPGAPMQRVLYDGTTWTFDTFHFQTDSSGNALVPFYRIAPPSITMDPSATTGIINIVFSAPVLDTSTPSLHIGTQFRYATRRMLITTVTDAVTATADVIDTLPGVQTLTLSNPPVGAYAVAIGDLVIGTQSGCEGLVTVVASPLIQVQIINNVLSGFLQFGANAGETIVTPSTRNSITQVSSVDPIPQPISVWDEQMISRARGWPQSCFTDQNRLGFCDLPGTPSGILWSWIGLPYNFDAGGNSGAIPTADYAIAELVPGRRRVYHVVPGAESSEFVFTDRGLYYIPISPSNPLKPGSVAFQLLSSDGCARVQPKVMQEVIIYINAGLVSVMAILAPGAYYRPFQTRELTSYNNHLIKSPIAIGVPTDDGQYDDRYFYILNEDGTLAVAKVDIENGDIKPPIGWVPWSGSGRLDWISVLGSTVLFSCHYDNPELFIVEQLDSTQYLDQAMFYNAVPAPLTPAVGLGPLWWIPDGTVTLMDNGTRAMGTYTVDANGFIIPQGLAGEDLTSATLVAGQPWTGRLEPLIPAVGPGTDNVQRMRKRKVARATVYVKQSTGFLFEMLFSGPLKRGGPALGATISNRRIETWNQDDDPTVSPPEREQAYTFKPLGRFHDPRIAFVKDTPGPIQILEISTEVTS